MTTMRLPMPIATRAGSELLDGVPDEEFVDVGTVVVAGGVVVAVVGTVVVVVVFCGGFIA